MAECRVPADIIGFLRAPGDEKTNVFTGDLTETTYSQNSFKWKLFTKAVPWKTVELRHARCSCS